MWVISVENIIFDESWETINSQKAQSQCLKSLLKFAGLWSTSSTILWRTCSIFLFLQKWGSDHLSLVCELAFADEGSETWLFLSIKVKSWNAKRKVYHAWHTASWDKQIHRCIEESCANISVQGGTWERTETREVTL